MITWATEAEKREHQFKVWREKVDAACQALYFVSIDDLADCCLADWFDDGISPKRAARKAMRYDQGFDD